MSEKLELCFEADIAQARAWHQDGWWHFKSEYEGKTLQGALRATQVSDDRVKDVLNVWASETLPSLRNHVEHGHPVSVPNLNDVAQTFAQVDAL